VLVAAALSIPIGLEREFRGKAAGLRTHAVVGTSCAALGYLSVIGVGDSQVADRTRIAGEVISGIGFMGAGVIFAFGGRVLGLTTAAALFGAAAVGLCTGMGAYLLATSLVVVTVLFLGPVDWVAARLIGARILDERMIRLVAADAGALVAVRDVLRTSDAEVRTLDVNPLGDAIAVQLIIRCRAEVATALSAKLSHVDGIGVVFDQVRDNP
jgi:putative Mg2+ transporter-C (MgtC) family protein